LEAANVRPIADLKNRAKDLVSEVSEGGEPVVITQHGRPMVVVMGTRQHERLKDTLAMLELLALSQGALARTGRTFPTAEVRRRAKAALQQASSGG
jgi:prevent-host-death family protein